MSDNNHFDSNLTEYTVSQISSALKRTVENAFERVRIHGEISGLKRAASGHVYLTLKDDKAVLDVGEEVGDVDVVDVQRVDPHAEEFDKKIENLNKNFITIICFVFL